MRLPHDEILAALAVCWKDWSGSDQPITADGNLVDWLQREGWWREIDLMDLRWPVSRHFGADLPVDEWGRFFSGEAKSEEEWNRDVAPTITFGRLSALIQRHLADVSFGPINVAGANCAAAGAFLGVQQLARFVDRNIERFGPSTRVRDRLSGERLVAFWSQLRLLTRNAVPPIKPYSQQWRVRVLFILLYCFAPAILAVVLGLVPGWPLRLFYGAYVGLLIIAAMGLDASRDGSLPKDIRTFRDLANRVADQFHTRSRTPDH